MLGGNDWRRAEGADPSAIRSLEDTAQFPLPSELLDMLRYSNGGEGPLAVQPFWFQLYPAEEIAEIERQGTFKKFFEGLFVFGGNGGGEAMAIDNRSELSGSIVCFDMTNIRLDESVLPIAPDFASFLQLVSRDEAAR